MRVLNLAVIFSLAVLIDVGEDQVRRIGTFHRKVIFEPLEVVHTLTSIAVEAE